MNKASINPVFVITMAVLPLVNVTQTLNEVVFLGLCAAFIYIVCASLVSIMEKMVDRNLIFFVFMILASTIATAMAYLYSILPNSIFVAAGPKVMYCAISASVLGGNLIYYNSKSEMSHYFFKLMIEAPSFLLIFFLFGAIREIGGYGTIWNIKTGLKPLAFLASNGGGYFILAVLCGFANAYWLNISKKRQQYDLLVDKYKIKLNEEHNKARIDVVNDSQIANFGVSELISKPRNGEANQTKEGKDE